MTRRIDITWPDGGDDAWTDGSDATPILLDAFFQPAVEVSFVFLGLPSGWLIATQQVGDFTQSAAGDVSGGAADFSASQAVGAFSQAATADVRVDASASQAVGAFSQSATSAVWAQASASQQVSAFTQTATAEGVVSRSLSAAQQVGDFTQVAAAENDSPVVVEQQATPGYASDARARYRVKVGKRWMVVDPLDAQSVKAAMDAAMLAAEEVAAERVVDPVKSAARAVEMKPVEAPRVDYAAVAADAKRISEQIREVYAQALQRELIARLMREQMDREDDDVVLMLLLG